MTVRDRRTRVYREITLAVIAEHMQCSVDELPADIIEVVRGGFAEAHKAGERYVHERITPPRTKTDPYFPITKLPTGVASDDDDETGS